uniref:Fructose-bisphosphate aldolase (FBP aldolase) (FBPA) ) n=1 Tax=Ganoderma boninense TaxID=34458 RepID=A0A5K1K288_9APHY|nr:Fructose-bisphosphate aldolase (FBP aldolase) (FBPA) (EC (Fructose-1,6-bisphosphate aldolase) [Ganoderma boninense]
MVKKVILITGASGFLGVRLASAINEDRELPDVQLILIDVIEPKLPPNSSAITIQADLTDPAQANALFDAKYGLYDAVYCLHGIMSRGSEDNFDLGIKVNVDSVRNVLNAARDHGKAQGSLIKFIFTSSLAVYGGPLVRSVSQVRPEVIQPDTIATPEGAYGTGKLVSELFVNEYTRRGFVDGRILRLPTVTVRPGPLSAATSAFISGIIREPLQGLPATCPIGNSLTSPELDLAVWIASPEVTLQNLVIARRVPAAAFRAHTRVVCLPGFTVTVREEIAALEAVAGKDAVALIRFEDDPENRRVVSSWPSRFDNAYALALGFVVDEGGLVPVVRRFQAQLKASAS